MKPNFELLAVEGRDELGEGPWWDAAAGLLWWVDIPSRRIRRATLDGIESPALATPSDVGFAVPDSAGGVIAGLATGLARQSQGSDTWAPLWSADHDPALLRLNDGKTDRRGGLWFGSMHRDETEAVGALFRLTEGGVVIVLDGITTSNGLGWSPDERTFYYTDSIA